RWYSSCLCVVCCFFFFFYINKRNMTTRLIYNASLYLLSNEANEVFEVKAFNERYHSWFIGQSVQHDGRLLFLTLMDPVFLLLPYFSKFGKEGKFQPVEQVVVDEAFPGCIQLLKCSQTLQCLSHVTEKKGKLQSFYRYNKDKTLTWLKKKVLYHFQSNLIIFVQVTIFIFLPLLEDYLRYAHGLVSEYISEDLSKDLLKYLQDSEYLADYYKSVQNAQSKYTQACVYIYMCVCVCVCVYMYVCMYVIYSGTSGHDRNSFRSNFPP
uniref:Ribonuclease H2 subunit B n=1 Tax=Erpetoichthys calabaricus TaxID=27687 RepID=A0A8C4XF73_ERPCA